MHTMHAPTYWPEHGGLDLGPEVEWDFSTNANPLPPAQALLQAITQADRSRYPEPSYLDLRQHLANHNLGSPERILPTAGSSEAIRRLTLAASRQGAMTVWLPTPGYGDYGAAAMALGLNVRAYTSVQSLCAAIEMLPTHSAAEAHLVWLCEPCNPTGSTLSVSEVTRLFSLIELPTVHLAIDLAYWPLRLTPQTIKCSDWTALLEHCWQLWSPNKSLGMTGIRAGVMVAPIDDQRLPARLVAHLSPSWVLSAEGVALLKTWHHTEVQEMLANSRATLRKWQAEQSQALKQLGWIIRPSHTPFNLAKPPALCIASLLNRLRIRGIKLRDAQSLGASGWLRLSAQPPAARTALLQALESIASQQEPQRGTPEGG